MSKHQVIRSIVVLLFFSLSVVAYRANKRPPDLDRPNIILILADDLGLGDLSVYNPDSKIQTPHLDALASKGVLFTDASTPSSVCTPTRYAIMTGRYAWRTRLKSGVLWSYERPLIDAKTITLPETLKAAGYNTAMFGKWHLGWVWPTSDGKPPIGRGLVATGANSGKNIDFRQPVRGGPIDHGFEYYFGVDVPNFPPYGWIENDRLVKIPTIRKPPDMYGSSGPMVRGWSLTDIAPTLTDRIVAYIKRREGHSKPFFLYYAMTSPHTPIAPTSAWRGTSKAGLYGDYVQQLDAEIGRITAILEETGQSKNTLIIFLSDNGSAGFSKNNDWPNQAALFNKYGHSTSLGLRGYKLSIHEGGFRIPMFVVWPNKILPGTRNNTPFTAIDLMPTLASFAKAVVSKNAAPDAFNAAAQWLGIEAGIPKRDHAIFQSYNGSFALRRGRYKLVAGSGDGNGRDKDASADAYFLYDLQADPHEDTNIAVSDPARLERMKRLFLTYQTYRRD